ncbi:hypothetical protein Slin15195_G018940 [Septoria linicola]|uniref:Uncharacterized protein n=1 Tax=Septoria linicola TaxID=215465 RepID=A0A9Q9AGC3_9PEZI|nr:hypothetical protein Slin15195_G018940 [Septoria linicola]
MARRSRNSRRRYATRRKTATASVDPPSSRLMTLPAELRVRIYEFVFEDKIIRSIGGQPFLYATIRGNSAPPLLRTCKQVYREAVDIYWSKVFCMDTTKQIRIRFIDRNTSIQPSPRTALSDSPPLSEWFNMIGRDRLLRISAIAVVCYRGGHEINLTDDDSSEVEKAVIFSGWDIERIEQCASRVFPGFQFQPGVVTSELILRTATMEYHVWTADHEKTCSEWIHAFREKTTWVNSPGGEYTDNGFGDWAAKYQAALTMTHHLPGPPVRGVLACSSLPAWEYE